MTTNTVQHYSTWQKTGCKELASTRASTLGLYGFEPIPYVLTRDEHGSPIEYARKLAAKMQNSDDFDCDSVHLVLLDCKNIDGWTGYRVYRKFIKLSD